MVAAFDDVLQLEADFDLGTSTAELTLSQAQELNISPCSSTLMMEEAAAMLGAHRGIILSQPRRPHQPQAVTSRHRLPPNLMEKLSPYSKLDDKRQAPSKFCKRLTFE